MGFGNPAKMMAQLQKMQADMARVQAELATTKIEGTAGGGAVTAVVTGQQELVSVTLDPGVVDADDVEMLQDLVTAAVNDALRRSREMAQQRIGAVTPQMGGLGGIPGLGG